MSKDLKEVKQIVQVTGPRMFPAKGRSSTEVTCSSKKTSTSGTKQETR